MLLCCTESRFIHWDIIVLILFDILDKNVKICWVFIFFMYIISWECNYVNETIYFGRVSKIDILVFEDFWKASVIFLGGMLLKSLNQVCRTTK